MSSQNSSESELHDLYLESDSNSNSDSDSDSDSCESSSSNDSSIEEIERAAKKLVKVGIKNFKTIREVKKVHGSRTPSMKDKLEILIQTLTTILMIEDSEIPIFNNKKIKLEDHNLPLFEYHKDFDVDVKRDVNIVNFYKATNKNVNGFSLSSLARLSNFLNFKSKELLRTCCYYVDVNEAFMEENLMTILPCCSVKSKVSFIDKLLYRSKPVFDTIRSLVPPDKMNSIIKELRKIGFRVIRSDEDDDDDVVKTYQLFILCKCSITEDENITIKLYLELKSCNATFLPDHSHYEISRLNTVDVKKSKKSIQDIST